MQVCKTQMKQPMFPELKSNVLVHQHFIPTPLQPSRWFLPCTHTKQEWFPASFLVPGLWCIWYTRSSSYEGCKRRRAGMHVNKISMRCNPVTKICEPDSKPSTNSSSRAEGCNRTRLVGLTASPQCSIYMETHQPSTLRTSGMPPLQGRSTEGKNSRNGRKQKKARKEKKRRGNSRRRADMERRKDRQPGGLDKT